MATNSSSNSTFRGYTSIHNTPTSEELLIDEDDSDELFSEQSNQIHNNGPLYKYKCPKCKGVFAQWAIKDNTKHCPFCGLEQFSYDPDE